MYQRMEGHASRMGPFVTLLLIIAVVWLIVMLAGGSRRRSATSLNAPKACDGCATPNPPHARFCRNCGKKL